MTDPTAAADRAVMQLEMQRNQPQIGDGVLWFAVLAFSPLYMLIAAVWAMHLVEGSAWQGAAGWLGALAALAAAVAFTAWRLRRRRLSLPRAPALVSATELVVTPRGAKAPLRVPFAEVRYTSRVPGQSLSLGLDAGPIELRDDDFVAPYAIEAIEEAYRHAVVALPDGAARYAAMQRQQRLTRLLGARAVPVTYALLGIIAALFMLELALGALRDPRQMVRLGANVPALVAEGQWWRLVTAGFLHGSVPHVVLNGVALLSVGSLLEKLVGPTRFLLIALVASIAGNVMSARAAEAMMSVGASSCVFGLLGALLVVQAGKRGSLPPQLVVQRRQWVYLLGVNAVISLLPGIDMYAHLGGFIGGALLGALLVPGLDIRRPLARWPLHAAAGALVLWCVGAFVMAFLHGGDFPLTRAMRPADGRVLLEMRRLPGFSLALPAGTVQRSGDYGLGKYVVSNVQPPTPYFVAVEWSGGEVSSRDFEDIVNAFARGLKMREPPRYLALPGPGGAAVRTAMLVFDGAPMRLAMLQCGNRIVQLSAMSAHGVDQLFASVLESFICTPDAKQETATAWAPPVVLDLPGWYAFSRQPGRLALSNGVSVVVLNRLHRRLDDEALALFLRTSGVTIDDHRAAPGGLRFSGKLDEADVEGWATQQACAGEVVAMFVIAPDEPTTSRLVQSLSTTRCRAPDEAAQRWPDQPSTAQK